MLRNIWLKALGLMNVRETDTALTSPEPEVSDQAQEAEESESSRQIKFFLAGIIGVSEDEITPEFLEARRIKNKAKELAEARAAGTLILTSDEVAKIVTRFYSEQGDRKKILELL